MSTAGTALYNLERVLTYQCLGGCTVGPTLCLAIRERCSDPGSYRGMRILNVSIGLTAGLLIVSLGRPGTPAPLLFGICPALSWLDDWANADGPTRWQRAQLRGS